jgi:hypothetical protein
MPELFLCAVPTSFGLQRLWRARSLRKLKRQLTLRALNSLQQRVALRSRADRLSVLPGPVARRLKGACFQAWENWCTGQFLARRKQDMARWHCDSRRSLVILRRWYV